MPPKRSLLEEVLQYVETRARVDRLKAHAIDVQARVIPSEVSVPAENKKPEPVTVDVGGGSGDPAGAEPDERPTGEA
jgi:hypothetical protein